MKIIIIFLTIICMIFQLKAQVPNNFTQPYSLLKNIEFDLSNISVYNINKPIFEEESLNSNDNYAYNIDSNIDVIEEGTKINLTNGKILTILRLKVEEAKSLNFTFKDFYLTQNTKIYIYNIDRTQVMGPITNINNSSSYNTHLIFSNDVVIEIVSDSPLENSVVLKNIAYGIKNSNYFEDIINSSDEEFKFLSILNTPCHPDIDTLKSNCHFVGENSPLDTFKQINCSQFDILNKVKRSLCVVITKDSLHTGWTAKSGILINTVDTSASNYCNSYVLTCDHCITTNPKYFAIRFNWLRKDCEIPSGIQNCNIDNQPWIDLINMDEVIDYCDVELISRKNFGGGYEFAFLKINNILRMKEFYSGWKIYEEKPSYNYTLDTCFIAGAWGQNPFQAMFQAIDLNQYHADLNFTQHLVSGHSGMSVFDNQAYFIGLNNQVTQALSISLLYHNIWAVSPTPRDILDPNSIYTTAFNNGDSIVVEGVERWEKNNCLKSTVNCNPTLDLSDYLTPIPGDGCCFKLEYIPAMTGFLGGTPYGIRIYRDNNTQKTLYYDFGTDIFARSDTAYNNPINGNIIEFCINSDDLTADGGKIVIEFLDNNGRIICRKVVELECVDCCSNARLQIDLLSEEPTPSCCALIIMTVDTSLTPQCVYSFANIYDNIDSTFITSQEIITFQDSLLSFPMFLCNYDTIPKQFLIEFYSTDSTISCSKLTNQFLPPCEVMGMVESTSKNKEKFDITTKSVKSDEIIFEYLINNDEKIKIELFNKYNISLGVIQNKDSKKGANEFKLNIEKLKSGIYIFKMNGKENSIIRRLIIE